MLGNGLLPAVDSLLGRLKLSAFLLVLFLKVPGFLFISLCRTAGGFKLGLPVPGLLLQPCCLRSERLKLGLLSRLRPGRDFKPLIRPDTD